MKLAYRLTSTGLVRVLRHLRLGLLEAPPQAGRSRRPDTRRRPEDKTGRHTKEDAR